VTLKISTLCENTAGAGDILGEWGLSILVETASTTVLLDTGKKLSATYNADSLGIDINKIDKIVLSHGHYDHTGGLGEILRRMHHEVDIIAHPDIWQAKYARRAGVSDRYIGIPFQRDELESRGARFCLTKAPVMITDDFMTTGEIPMVTSFEDIPSTLVVKEGSDWRQDNLMDDQALIIKTPKGLVVVLGCAHRGIINTIYHAQRITDTKTIYAIIGGSHLVGASEERLVKTIAALRDIDAQKLGLCHCTDLPAASLLAQEFGDAFFFNKAGTVLELGEM